MIDAGVHMGLSRAVSQVEFTDVNNPLHGCIEIGATNYAGLSIVHAIIGCAPSGPAEQRY